uniref:HIT domain-containing protein n=1 Tax=Staphylothermus marinus TaxID=2280 RepID=A0A7C4H8Q2_STAMA
MSNLKILWNPWRFEYVKSTTKSDSNCIFCKLPNKSDEESYIVYRGKYSYIALNAYPYNSGHLMIIPYKHVACFDNLNNNELFELIVLTKASTILLRETFNPDGFNIGLNIGRAAGAGVADHIHIHVVPRWIGDTNFMAIIASTKTLPVALSETYSILKNNVDKLINVINKTLLESDSFDQ